MIVITFNRLTQLALVVTFLALMCTGCTDVSNTAESPQVTLENRNRLNQLSSFYKTLEESVKNLNQNDTEIIGNLEKNTKHDSTQDEHNSLQDKRLDALETKTGTMPSFAPTTVDPSVTSASTSVPSTGAHAEAPLSGDPLDAEKD